MANQSENEKGAPKLTLVVELDAVALWEPVPHAQKGAKAARQVAGLSVQSWDFHPADKAQGATIVEIVVRQPAMFFTLEDGMPTLVANELEWRVDGRYVETRDFADSEGTPRPKHFFELKVPKGLEDRLRESPADILARSDLFEDGGPPEK